MYRTEMTSTKTTLQFSSVSLCVHGVHKNYWRRGAQDGHLDFYTPPELCRMGVYVILYILMYLTDMTSTKNSAIQFSVALHPE